MDERLTVGALIREGIERLRATGSETPRLDTELLLGHAIGAERTGLVAHPERQVDAPAAALFRAHLDRRAGGEPVAYLRGLKEFHGLAFQVDGRALIPRPETERLVELALAAIGDRLAARSAPLGGRDEPIRVADVGTGSGAIAIALLVALRQTHPGAAVEVLGVDISPDALALARVNAVAHAVADRIVFAEADLLPDRPERDAFDLVVANLPYVRQDAMAGLPRATSFEPVVALDGGADGLAVIGRLLERLPDVVADRGEALFEIGADQGEAIVDLVAARLPGWSCTVERDLAGLPRVARISRN